MEESAYYAITDSDDDFACGFYTLGQNDEDLPDGFKAYLNSHQLCLKLVQKTDFDVRGFHFSKARIFGKIRAVHQSNHDFEQSVIALPYSLRETTISSQQLEDAITQLLTRVMTKANWSKYYPVLVQFWAPTRVGEHYELRIRNQPFAIHSANEGIFQYRMMSEKYSFCEGDGLPGRVFLNKVPEFSPDVEYYSTKEYVQKDDALNCGVRATCALPVFDSSHGTCVGVLELTSIEKSLIDYLTSIPLNEFKAAGLNLSVASEHSSIQDNASSAGTEGIHKVLRLFFQSHNICCAQAWAFCKDCEHRSKGNTSSISCRRVVLSAIPSVFHLDSNMPYVWISRKFHTLLGNGVVSEATLSHKRVFCTDVTQFNIAEYPLAHYARDCGLKGCFGICLSSTYIGSFILEIFISDSYSDIGDLETSLRKMLETLRQCFKTFNFDSFEELMDDLPIKVIDFQNGKRFEYVLEPKNCGHFPGAEIVQSGVDTTETFLLDCQLIFESANCRENVSTENQGLAVQNGVEIVKILPIDQQQKLDPVNRRANFASLVQNENVQKGKDSLKKILRRPKTKTGFQVSYEDLQKVTHLKVIEAAKSLKVSRSTFKRICREFGIQRWPPRGDSLHQSTSASPSIQSHQMSDISEVDDANLVTVVANYIDNITIKFRLNLSSGLVNLHEHVAKRLKIEQEDYYVKYRDEDERLILLACDEDLWDCVSTCKSKTSIEVWLVRKIAK